MAAAKDETMGDRSRQPTWPPGGLQAVYDPGPDSADEAQGPVRRTFIPTADPQAAVLMRAVASLEAIAKPMGRVIERAEKVGVKTSVVVMLAVLAVLSGLVFGVGGAVVAVWVHDQSTRGTVTARLDDQDKAINGLIDAVNGVIDEGEGDMECITAQLEALQAGKTIPKCSTRGRDKLRRDMPGKIVGKVAP